MALALIASSLASVFALAFVAYHGFRVPEAVSVTRHVTYAVPTMVIAMFAHSMAMFYFIGTGVQIKDAVRRHGLAPALMDETKLYKKKVFPAAMLAMALVMAAFVLGGGVHTGSVPRLVHTALALAALAAGARAALVETRFIFRNLLLAERVAGLAEDASGAAKG